MNKGKTVEIKDLDELEFAIFCVENVAIHLKISAEKVYDALKKKSNILNGYIVPGYEILHTQSKDYILNDILSVMQEEGVKL